MTETAIYAAGGVVWRVVDGKLMVLLIHRTRYRDVTLPKGKVDPGEMLAETAVREIHEETGIRVALGVPVGVSKYHLPSKRQKIVHYWAAEATDVAIRASAFVPNREIAALEWATPKKARSRLSYPVDVEILQNFIHLVDEGVLAHLPDHRAAPRQGPGPRGVGRKGCGAASHCAREEAGERDRRAAARLRHAQDHLEPRDAVRQDRHPARRRRSAAGSTRHRSSARTRGKRASPTRAPSSGSASGRASPPCCAVTAPCSPRS